MSERDPKELPPDPFTVQAPVPHWCRRVLAWLFFGSIAGSLLVGYTPLELPALVERVFGWLLLGSMALLIFLIPVDWVFWRFSKHYDPLARRRATEKAFDESPAWQLFLIAGPMMLTRVVLRWSWRISLLTLLLLLGFLVLVELEPAIRRLLLAP